VKTGGVSKNESGSDFQARLQGLYRQPKRPNNEQNFMTLAKTWNKSVPTLVVARLRLQNSDTDKIEMSVSLVDDEVSSQS